MPKRNKLVVIICGLAGSGKSTAATRISKRFKLKHVSAGDQFRAVAKERKMSLIELGRYAEKHPEFDKELDRRMMIAAKKGGVVLDGRASAYLSKKLRIPAIKIFLTVDPKISAKRVAKRDGISAATALKTSRQREREVARRLKALYGLDTSSTAYYDAVIQTDRYRPEEVAELIASLVTYGN
ncbi:MAG: nucleoside monophosphate kinase [Patescibacteria group bacterium]|nr:MAG: nucleoside monophosphate kinase [Patescibacteria group bacterium]